MREEKLALLLTDVVDSTKMNGDHGDAVMAEVWRQHDEGARSLMQTWRGREIGRSDGFLIVFDVVPDALEFARGYHRHLSGLGVPMQARIGIHHGPVRLRRNRDVDTERGATLYDIDGIALPMAARVMSTASARQTLLTADAVLALGAAATEPLVSHGHWRLKGIAEPVELFEASGDGALLVPPPDSEKSWRVVRQGHEWWPVRTLAHSLPAERDRFVGREGPLQQTAAAFDGGARLVTLAGIGGIGKTRLALCFARRWLGAWPGGAWFCDLSSARSLDGIVHAVAQGLDIELGRGDVVKQLGSAIAGRGRVLVVLDNFEQVVEHAEGVVGTWLQRAPQALFLVTSREALGIVGEQVQTMPAMELAEAQALFVERVRASGGHGDYADAEATALPRLVELLDRLPLALELAAARARLMPPTMLVQRMGQRFQLLASRHGRIERQATLRAAIDWSWDLLTPDERTALMQLAAFESGFTLEAAAAVVELPGGGWVHDAVQGLLEKSLLRSRNGERLDMLVSVQHYARERWASGDVEHSIASLAQMRHWRFFAQLTEDEAVAGRGVEIENLVVACQRAAGAVGTGGGARDYEAAVALLANASAVLRLTGPLSAIVTLAEGLLASSPGLAPSLRARVLYIEGSALLLLGHIEKARAALGESIRVLTESDRWRAAALCGLGELESMGGEASAAVEMLQEALATSVACGEVRQQCRALNALGALALDTAQPQLARSRYLEALALARQFNDTRWEGGLLCNVGSIAFSDGDLQEAELRYDEALTKARTTGHNRWEGSALCNLGLLKHRIGRSEEALDLLDRAYAFARKLGHAQLEGVVLCNLGIVNEALGNFELAREQLESALSIATGLGDLRIEGQFRGYLGLVYTRLGQSERARECLARGEFQLRAAEDAVSLGVLLCIRARLDRMTGQPLSAEAALLEATRLAEANAVRAESELAHGLRDAISGR